MEKSVIRKPRILVIAPGANSSTYDVFRYSLNGLRDYLGEDAVDGFSTHNMIMYHYEAHKMIFDNMSSRDIRENAMVRTSLDMIAEVYVKRPDVVHIIDGTMFPIKMLEELYRLRKETNRSFLISVHFTEEPYAGQHTVNMSKYIDVLFVNDKNMVEKFDPDDSRHVYYLQNSFSKNVHYPPETRVDEVDVFFCGTMFPEREKLFDGVDWSGISTRFFGTMSREKITGGDGWPVENRYVDNKEVAVWYRKSKIALNKHRESDITGKSSEGVGRAYSINPRIIEAAACGAFQLSDYRPELVDLFGDSIATYRDADDLSDKIRYYLDHEKEREDMAASALKAVSGMSYSDRSVFMVEKMVEALSQVRPQRLGGKKNG